MKMIKIKKGNRKGSKAKKKMGKMGCIQIN